MDTFVQVTVFLVLPYVALAALVGGCIYRLVSWLSARRITGLRSVAIVPNTFGYRRVLWDLVKRVFAFYTLRNMEGDRTLVVGSVLFHYGISIVLLAHLGLVVPLPISPGLHDWLGLYVGGAAGLVALAGLVILIVRRIRLPRMRELSTLGEYFAPGLLLAIIAFGLVQTLVVRPDYMDTVAPWLTSILEFSPNLAPIAGVGFFTIAHVALALVFIAYVPYGQMVHWLGYLFNPTLTGPSFRVGTTPAPAFPGVGSHSGRRPT